MDLERVDGIKEKETESNNFPDEVNLLKYVNNLTPEDIDKLIDLAKNIPDTEERSESMTKYLSLVNAVFGNSSFNTVGNTPHTRKQRYEVYEEMDTSTAYISAALDILSDDATQPDDHGVIIHIDSDSAKVTNVVTAFIEEFELESKISKWARAIAKYGDLFIKVDGDYTEGVTYINDTIYPGVVDRRDMNGKLVAFANNNDTNYDVLYAPWEFVHFRHKGDIYKEESTYARLGVSSQEVDFDKNLTSAYGQSILRPAIKTYYQLRFVENMILLSRLTNSIRRNIFLINVGDTSPDKSMENIANYARLLKKDVNLNIEENMYSSSRHTVNYDEDIFIPVGDPQNDVRIETVGGDVNIKEQYDLEYLLNKLFSALKIPKAYLNYEQDLNARSTLIQLDIRYARSVSQLQNTLVSGLLRLINIHLAYLGLDPEEVDLDISLTSVSAIDEEAREEQRSRQIANARDMFDLLQQMNDVMSTSVEGEVELDNEGNPIPTQPSNQSAMNMNTAIEYLMSDYLDMDQNLIDKVFCREVEEVKPHKIYSSFDVRAPYPNETNCQEFERLRESLTCIEE